MDFVCREWQESLFVQFPSLDSQQGQSRIHCHCPVIPWKELQDPSNGTLFVSHWPVIHSRHHFSSGKSMRKDFSGAKNSIHQWLFHPHSPVPLEEERREIDDKSTLPARLSSHSSLFTQISPLVFSPHSFLSAHSFFSAHSFLSAHSSLLSTHFWKIVEVHQIFRFGTTDT